MKLNFSFFKQMNIYLIGSLIQNLIPFIALPIITNYILPSEYASITMFTIMISFFTAFIGINSSGAISRRYVDKDSIDYPQYIGNTLIVFIFSVIIVSICTYIFRNLISFYTTLSYFWIYISIIATSLEFFIITYTTILRMQNMSIIYGIFNVIRSLINTSLIVFFVVSLNKNWEGYVVANVLTTFLFCIISIFLLHKTKNLKIKYKKDYVINIVKFGVPLIPHTLAAIAIAMTDRLLLVNMVSEEAAGIYQVGWQLSLPIGLLIESFKNGYISWLFTNLKSEIYNNKIVKVTYLIILSFVILSIIFILATQFLVSNFFDSKYNSAVIFIPYLISGLVFNGAYYTVGLIISYAEKTSLLSILTFTAGSLNVIFSYYLIKKNGMVGAAQGTFLAYFMTFIFTWILSNKVHPMPWLSFWKKRDQVY